MGSSGNFGTGGMVISEGSDGSRGRWRCGGSLGAGACWAGGWGGGACCGGGACWGGAVLLGVLDDGLVLLGVLLVVVAVLLVDELVSGAIPPPGPRLVSWMMPQITRPSINAISPNQAINTDRRRNHGTPVGAANSADAGAGGASNGTYAAYWVGLLPG
ncbi:hypothetical protein [Mycolicibacter minnesotensis]